MPITKAMMKLAVDTAFREAGEAKITVEYHSVVTGAYDADLDTLTNTDVPHTIKVINTKLNDVEMDYFPAAVVTQKILIRAHDLPVVPAESDYVIWNNVSWQVRKVKRIPGDQMYIVFLQLT